MHFFCHRGFYLLCILILNSVVPDPCEESSVCGTCAICSVVNHGVQCSCPVNFLGNPLVSCSKPSVRCGTGITDCQCDEAGYCTSNCNTDYDCSCGETCAKGKCRTKCSGPNSCAQVNTFLINVIPNILLNTDEFWFWWHCNYCYLISVLGSAVSERLVCGRMPFT
jgi:hypothetical protein